MPADISGDGAGATDCAIAGQDRSTSDDRNGPRHVDIRTEAATENDPDPPLDRTVREHRRHDRPRGQLSGECMAMAARRRNRARGELPPPERSGLAHAV